MKNHPRLPYGHAAKCIAASLTKSFLKASTPIIVDRPETTQVKSLEVAGIDPRATRHRANAAFQ